MRAKLDPVTLEVIRNALPAIANEMAVDLQRTSYNMMIYEVRDFCTALVNVDGELLAFAMVRAHWIDVGGMSTGFGAGPEVPDPWQEGLQLDQLKIYDGGRLDEPLYRVIRDNIRFPESSLGDMNSQIASCKLGIRRLDELVRKYGRETLLRAIARIFDETEAQCRKVVAKLADGVYEAESFFDDDGVTPDERVRIHA